MRTIPSVRPMAGVMAIIASLLVSGPAGAEWDPDDDRRPDPSDQPPHTNPMMVAGGLSLGVGGLMTIGGLSVGATDAALVQASEIRSSVDGSTPEEHAPNPLLGFGLAIFGGGIVLLAVGNQQSLEQEAAKESDGSTDVQLRAYPGGLVVRGTF